MSGFRKTEENTDVSFLSGFSEEASSLLPSLSFLPIGISNLSNFSTDVSSLLGFSEGSSSLLSSFPDFSTGMSSLLHSLRVPSLCSLICQTFQQVCRLYLTSL